LTKCYRKLGGDGSALVHDALIGNMTAKQIATARGLCVADERYISRRIGECLDTLAVTFGYSSRRFNLSTALRQFVVVRL